MADTIEDVEEVAEDDIDTNKTADADGEWSQDLLKPPNKETKINMFFFALKIKVS